MTYSSDKNPSRRHVVGGVGAGLMAAATTVAQAQSNAPQGAMQMGAAVLTDPREKYPKPPFKKQSQPFPGLASKMTPVPDHGEKSYRGSGRLTGRKALITGGDSGMGRAAAIAYARQRVQGVREGRPTPMKSSRSSRRKAASALRSRATSRPRRSADSSCRKPSAVLEASTFS